MAAGTALDDEIALAPMRAREQVRTDVANPNLPVKIIATVGGLSGGHRGPTRRGIADIGVMRMMPSTAIAPGDPRQLAQFMAVEVPGPVPSAWAGANDLKVNVDGQQNTIGHGDHRA
jgi:transketolase C-terminal domain/subunit